MADTAIAITAGTGTNVDTRTEATNGNHRQVVVIGDPATNAGVAPVDVTNGLSVTLTTALPAGTAAIGKLAANSGVDIGDVDVTSVPTDPFGANADAASATTSISAKLKGIATALGVTALDLGSGTGGSRTLRSFSDTAQWVGGTGTDTSATQRVSLATNVALPAGTNAIGKLSANSGVDIGDVDITTVVPGTGATQLGKAIDSVPGSTDTGVAALVVRDDAIATLTPVDGDYTTLRVDSKGALWTAMVNSSGTRVDPVAAGTAAMAASVPVTVATDDTQFAALLAAVRGRTIQVVPTVQNAAFAQYDVLAATAVLTSATAANDVPAVLRTVTARWLDRTTGIAIRVWLLRANTGVGTINNAFAPADADVSDLIGYVDFAAAEFIAPTGMVNCFSQKAPEDADGKQIDLLCTPASGTKNVYYAVQAMEGVTPGATTDLELEFHFI